MNEQILSVIKKNAGLYAVKVWNSQEPPEDFVQTRKGMRSAEDYTSGQVDAINDMIKVGGFYHWLIDNYQKIGVNSNKFIERYEERETSEIYSIEELLKKFIVGQIPSIRKDIFGYFENANDEKPAHDPGLDTICPICARSLSLPVKTISLMKEGDNKSYFYRTHKQCYESADDKLIQEIESSLIDNI